MRIFVTGATGVIGRRAVPLLISRGHDVTAVARSPDRRAALHKAGASVVDLDIFDGGAVRRAMAGHDTVVNLATSIPSGTLRPLLRSAWAETDRIRTHASATLVDAALSLGVQRFIQESFAPIYPDCGDRWIDENVYPQPARYNRSTLDAEGSAKRFTGEGRSGVVLRFAFLYGPNDGFTRQLMSSVRRGWVPLLGPADGYFSMLSHDDAALCVSAALTVPSGIYNAVDNEPLTRRAIGESIASVLKVDSPKHLPAWTAKLAGVVGGTLSRSLRISNAKLRQASEWTPKYPSFREGIAAVRRSE